ncbi:succinate dehydrogenase/fumarate reductase iron-sulfur subunit [bacterium]|nr:succinate dehydrogenase/fumarate reductase iron-sulfur subunit [bacterium]
MKLHLKVWRQKSRESGGYFETYEADGLNPNMSFLEMLDVVNDRLTKEGKEPIAFDHDCREGICGSCAMAINGEPHGPNKGATTCQVYLRSFRDGETLTVEPWRAKAFPVLKDLVTDRSAFDRIIQAGGFISVNTGQAPEKAFDAAHCIGCGACVAACRNGSAMLFAAAKISHLGLLPQGQPEREARVRKMVEAMDAAGFGNCSNQYACEAVCPKEISADWIARMNRDYAVSALKKL